MTGAFSLDMRRFSKSYSNALPAPFFHQSVNRWRFSSGRPFVFRNLVVGFLHWNRNFDRSNVAIVLLLQTRLDFPIHPSAKLEL